MSEQKQDMYDCIVIGAGCIGSSTAWKTAERGAKTLLLEQFSFLHNKGSSHGKSRVTRLTYPEDQYAALMPHAYRLWAEAEKASGMKVFTKTGGLDFGERDWADMQAIIASCERFRTPYELLDSKQVAERWPFKLPASYVAVYQPDTGILDPTESVRMFLKLARQHGADCRDNEKVLSVDPQSESEVHVTTDKGTYRAKSVVIAAGPWLPKLAAAMKVELPPVEIWKVSWGYYPVAPEADPAKFAVGSFPIFINYQHKGYYGFPAHERPGYVKVATHFHTFVEIVVDPDTRSMVPTQGALDLTGKWVKEIIPGLQSRPEHTETCLYTKTADWNFIVDAHPRFKNVVFSGGYSGHGFKFAPLMGYINSRLALDARCEYSLADFALPQNRARAAAAAGAAAPRLSPVSAAPAAAAAAAAAAPAAAAAAAAGKKEKKRSKL